MSIGNVLNSGSSTATNSSTTTTTGASTQLSEVQRLLQQKAAADAPQTSDQKPYTEQEWFIRAQVANMQIQIDFYSRMPDSIGGPVIDSLTEQANKLITKLQTEAKAKQEEMDAKQAELDKIQREKNEAAQTLTADQLLDRAQRRARGEKVEDYVPPDINAGTKDDPNKNDATSSEILSVDDMLKRAKENAAKGSTVNTVA